jgi:hypothetical protein
MTTFYCLRFEIPPTRKTRFPYLYLPGTEWPSYTPRHWVPFSFVASYDSQDYGGGIRPRLHTGFLTHSKPQLALLIRITLERTAYQTLLPTFLLLLHVHIHCQGDVFTETLPSNVRLFWFCYPGFQQICHSTIAESVWRDCEIPWNLKVEMADLQAGKTESSRIVAGMKHNTAVFDVNY